MNSKDGSDNQNLAGQTRLSCRATRKVSLVDHSQKGCSVFWNGSPVDELLGRADYDDLAAEVKVVIVNRGENNRSHRTTNSQ